MAEEIVQVTNLSLSYRNVQAVKNVSFTVKPGEILAVIGQNGSGKTSTVECIEGLRKPDGGQILVFSKDPVKHRREVYKKLGVQLQETEYPLKIKVAELCRLFASFYDRPADWRLLLSQLHLDEKKNRPVRTLSGGERQRLSILLSLMGRPRLLILDELTTGLDPEVRQNIWRSFESIRQNGIAIIMVSHYLDEVETLADKLLYLDRGEERFFGTQKEFREYAAGMLPDGEVTDLLTLEQLYLRITPKTETITMEGIL